MLRMQTSEYSFPLCPIDGIRSPVDAVSLYVHRPHSISLGVCETVLDDSITVLVFSPPAFPDVSRSCAQRMYREDAAILNVSQACRSRCLEMRLPAGHSSDRARRNSPFKLASCYTISLGHQYLTCFVDLKTTNSQ